MKDAAPVQKLSLLAGVNLFVVVTMNMIRNLNPNDNPDDGKNDKTYAKADPPLLPSRTSRRNCLFRVLQSIIISPVSKRQVKSKKCINRNKVLTLARHRSKSSQYSLRSH